MINPQLLIFVLKLEFEVVKNFQYKIINNIVNITYDSFEDNKLYPNSLNFNIHELASLYKEWAFTKCFEIHSFKRANRCYRAYPVKLNRGGSNFEVSAITEPEAIFKACEYIFDAQSL